MIFIMIALIFIPFLAWTAEVAYHDMLVAFREVKGNIVECDPAGDPSSCADTGTLVHLSSDQVTGSVQDEDFGVSLAGGLRLHREVEYCQWSEHKTESCETCTRTDSEGNSESYQCNCVTTFHYTKGWRNHRILSVMFDQPAAHHNPQRNPYPPDTYGSSNARLGAYPLKHELIMNPHGAFRATRRRVEWTRGAQREPQWYDFILRLFWNDLAGNTRYEAIENLRGVERAPAASQHNFVYVGNGGYFFSPYEMTDHGKMFNLFMQYLEGSLLDWQLGDIMPSCTAGDIRVSYRVADPTEASVVGGVVPAERTGTALGLFLTSKNYALGIVHEGVVTAYQMFDREAWEGKKWCLFCRLLLFPCCIAFAEFIAVFSNRCFIDWKATAAAAVAVEGVLVSVGWSILWKFDFDKPLQDVSMALLGVVAVLVGSVAFKRSTESVYGGGFGAVGRWLNDVFALGMYGSAVKDDIKAS